MGKSKGEMLTIEQLLVFFLDNQEVLMKELQESTVELKSRMVELELKLRIQENALDFLESLEQEDEEIE